MQGADVQLRLESGRGANKYGRVSASHQDNLFVTTEKKAAQQQQLLYLLPTEQEKEVVLNPSLDFKIRSNNEGIAGNSLSK